MAPAQTAVCDLEAVEARHGAVCRVTQTGCERRPGRSNGGQRSWPVAAGELARAQHRTAQCLLRLARDSEIDCETYRLTRRTAVCGPACTVVWEGRSREASPYPDPTRFHIEVGAGLVYIVSLMRWMLGPAVVIIAAMLTPARSTRQPPSSGSRPALPGAKSRRCFRAHRNADPDHLPGERRMSPVQIRLRRLQGRVFHSDRRFRVLVAGRSQGTNGLSICH